MRIISRVTVVAVLAALTGVAALSMRDASSAAMLSGTDYAEIQQLAYRYARGYDSADGALFARAFAADAVLTLGTTVLTGREQLTEFGARPNANKGPLIVHHVVANVLIEPGAEGATGVVYTVLTNVGQDDKVALTGAGIYQDVYVKGREGWRIKTRKYSPTRLGTAALTPAGR